MEQRIRRHSCVAWDSYLFGSPISKGSDLRSVDTKVYFVTFYEGIADVMKRKSVISLILGIVVSAITFYYAFKNVPFNELLDYLTSINYFWVIPSILAVIISFVLRVIRWQVILDSAHKISFWSAFHPLMIGFMINCVLPARVGEVARPAILKKNDNVPFATGMATVVAERLFDVILIIVLFAVSLSVVQIDPDLNIPFGDFSLNFKTLNSIFRNMIVLCVVLCAVIVMISIDSFRKYINLAINKIPSLFIFAGTGFKDKIHNDICAPVILIIENISSGFALVKDPKKICICIFLSFLVWVIAIFSYFIMSFGCPGIDLTFIEMTAVTIIICFFIALPSVPGFWGLWEAGGIFALSLFGVSTKDAFGFTLANHAIQMMPCIIIGLVSAAMTGINILQIQYEGKINEISK